MWFTTVTPEVGDFAAVEGVVLQNLFDVEDLLLLGAVGGFDFILSDDESGYGESVSPICLPSTFTISLNATITGADVSPIIGLYPIVWIGNNAYKGNRFGIYLYGTETDNELSLVLLSENSSGAISAAFAQSGSDANSATISIAASIGVDASGISGFTDGTTKTVDSPINGAVEIASGKFKLGLPDRLGLVITYSDLRIDNILLDDMAREAIVAGWGS